ncbi:MAG: hypothetical protein K0R44_10 [Thermomicrobiales bacterium]|nr:hypothetical protein [Thermomicrobiales bacterium]MDF3014785.1 hypothetical protein [Thermomicrobiales bacterium]
MVSEGSQIVVRLPDVETGQLEELCEHFGLTRSQMVRRMIHLAHSKLPSRSDPAELKGPSKLAKQLEERAAVRIRNRRSGLQKVEPAACERHQWTALGDGLDQCQVCLAMKG